MFMPVLESMSKITAATAEMQQEAFKRWFGMWPNFPAGTAFPTVWGDQVQKFQKKWAEGAADLLKRYREILEAQFKAGQKNIEKAFQLNEAKSPEELRAKTVEFWQNCVEQMRGAAEAQMREFQVAVEKWFELMKPVVPS